MEARVVGEVGQELWIVRNMSSGGEDGITGVPERINGSFPTMQARERKKA